MHWFEEEYLLSAAGFQYYSDVLGQLVNFDKYKLFTSVITATRRNMRAKLLGFTVGTIPF